MFGLPNGENHCDNYVNKGELKGKVDECKAMAYRIHFFSDFFVNIFSQQSDDPTKVTPSH